MIAIFVVFLTLALANTAIAQELSAIIGQVRDESGAILPGVTVSVTSPVLQVKQVTDVTNVQGEYRITPLPIGTYTVSYQLEGFSSMRQEGIRLDLGATVRLDITLKLGTLTETLTVSGAAPVVDVTATSASTQFTRETLELTPTSRNGAISLMVQAPGVRAPGRLDVGGGTVGDTPEFSSFGQPIESFMVMEGLVTSDSRIQTQGGNYSTTTRWKKQRSRPSAMVLMFRREVRPFRCCSSRAATNSTAAQVTPIRASTLRATTLTMNCARRASPREIRY